MTDPGHFSKSVMAMTGIWVGWLLLMSVISLAFAQFECPSDWSNLDAGRLSQINFFFCKPSESNEAQIPAKACTGFTQNQISDINTCGGISPDCLANIPAKAFGSTTSDTKCLQTLSTRSLPKLTTDQAREFGSFAWGAFSRDQLAAIPPAAYSTLDGKSFFLKSSSCGAIYKEALAAIPAAGLDSMKADCFANIPVDSIPGLSTSQIGAIGISAMGGWTPLQLASLPTDRCSGFTDKFFFMKAAACRSMTAECANQMSSSAIRSTTQDCVSNMPDSMFKSVKESYITSLSCGGFGGFSGEKIKNMIVNLGTQIIDKLNPQKLAIVPSSSVENFVDKWYTEPVLKESNTRLCDLKDLTFLKVAFSSNSSASCLSSRKSLFSALGQSSNFFAALRQGHVAHMPLSFFQDMPLLKQFNTQFLGALSNDQVMKIPCDSFRGLYTLPSLNQFGPLQAVSPRQLSAVWNESVGAFGCATMSNFSIYQTPFFSSEYCRHRTCYRIDAPCRKPVSHSYDTKFEGAAAEPNCEIRKEFLEFTWTENECTEKYGDGDRALSPGAIAAIVLVPLFAIGCGGAAFWYFKIRPKTVSTGSLLG